MAKANEDIELLPVADEEREWRDALQAGLVGRAKQPLNCELPTAGLGGEVTPTQRFFRRNHFALPELDPASYRLEVTGLVREPFALSVAELRELPAESLTVTLECAGNGRAGFSPPAAGERWGLGAVSTARWTGARLRDVLERAQPLPRAREVIFRGADGGPLPEVPAPIRFERSLPVPDALTAGALLAYEMNGEPLPVRHGFPVRLVVPGWYAMAAVKWLTEIEVTAEPFRGFFQDTHYVYEWRRHGRAEREPVRRQRVRAMITSPAGGQRIPAGDVLVRGVAWSGQAPLTHVEVSTGPRGRWQRARLTGRATRYGWRQWELLVRGIRPGPVRVRARAADAAGNGQHALPEWNALGYGGNFVHEVTVTAA
jgi:DMSO/TMAO reductase YedYZ molybdopterin-dependent catalytic subunit